MGIGSVSSHPGYRVPYWIFIVGLGFPAITVGISARAAEAPILAVFDMEDRGSGLDAGTLSDLTDYLAAMLTAGGYQVLPRAQIRERLLEAKKESYRACYDQTCQIELGRELAAQKTLSTQALRISDRCQFTAVLYDLKKATAEKAAAEDGPCDPMALRDTLERISVTLCKPLGIRTTELPGSLLVQSTPEGAKVYVDDEAVGKTPITMQMTAGEHQVRVTLAEYRESSRQVVVAAGQRTKTAFALEAHQPGKLVISSEPPGASVRIDDKAAGLTPHTETLKPGEYTVLVSEDGYRELQQKVRIDWDLTTETRLSLARILPLNTWGHVTFWSGLGLAALGGILNWQSVEAAKDFHAGIYDGKSRSQTFMGLAITGFSAGGALLITGVILWNLAPSEEGRSRQTAPAIGPSADGKGLNLSIGGRF